MQPARRRDDDRAATGISLPRLIRLRGAGESLLIAAPRVRVATSGGHISSFKGRGVEFDESRLYQPGDDLRTIDWRVTARTGEPHTKVYREERNRPIMVWVDLRPSMMFATQGVFKAVIAAEAAAIVSWSAVTGGDRLGGFVFSDSEHHELRPHLGRRTALRLFQLMCDSWQLPAPAAAAAERSEHALMRLVRVARPGSLLFLASDFRSLDEAAEQRLRKLALHCDLLLLHIFDAVEMELPPAGRYRINSGGRTISIETGDSAARERYRLRFEARLERLERLQRLPGIAVVRCRTTDDPRQVLAQHFRTR